MGQIAQPMNGVRSWQGLDIPNSLWLTTVSRSNQTISNMHCKATVGHVKITLYNPKYESLAELNERMFEEKTSCGESFLLSIEILPEDQREELLASWLRENFNH